VVAENAGPEKAQALKVLFIKRINNRPNYEALVKRPPSCRVYRVAQNKIPHQTICNISATSGLIFENS